MLNRKFINLIPTGYSMVGNASNFSRMDVLRCFLRLVKDSGRQELARDLELGEGTVRTILSKLKSNKLLDSTKKGHSLSSKGNRVLGSISKKISGMKETETKEIYPNAKKIAILLRNAPNLKSLHRLRDIAVKNGADGALILKFNGKLYAPESGYEKDFRALERLFDLSKNDALVIAFSFNRKSAENGALAIAVELDKSLKNFIKKF